jgi:hypothetical protein
LRGLLPGVTARILSAALVTCRGSLTLKPISRYAQP